jgi:hypothetical protein
MAQGWREHDRDEQEARLEPARESPEPDPAIRLASGVGNRAFGALARQGAGILPDGRVHPDIEATIGRARGGGQPVDDATRGRVGPALGDDLQDVRVHSGPEADQLARSVSARAFTTGRDLFFADGEHAPGTASGDQLLAHELTHAVQQRDAPTGGPLMVSQPGDELEVEADRAAGEIPG